MPDKYIYTHVPVNSDYGIYNATYNTGIGDGPLTQTGVDQFVRNSNCVLNGVDITCISPAFRNASGSGNWNSYRRWTLLTENIVISASHWNPWRATYDGYALNYGVIYTGDHAYQEVLFVDNNDQNVIARVLGVTLVVGDLMIGILDEPITGVGITPAKIFPKNLPFTEGLHFGTPLPVTCFDQQAHVQFLTSYPADWNYDGDRCTEDAWIEGEYFDLVGENRGLGGVVGDAVEGRDSGSSLGYIWEGQFIIAGTFYTEGGTSYGPGRYRDETNNRIQFLASGLGKPEYLMQEVSVGSNFKFIR